MPLTKLTCSLVLFAVVAFEITTGTNHLSQAVVALIEQTFVRRTVVLNVYIKCKEEPQRVSYFTDLTNSVLRGFDEVLVRIGWQQELPIDQQRHFCVFGVDTLGSLQELWTQLWIRQYNIEGYILIILRTFTSSYYDVLVDICKENLKMGIVNANVVIEPLPGVVLLFTYFPFSEFACFSDQPVLINEFKDDKWQHGEMFPPKLRDLHGCPLICATWEDMPYLKIHRHGDGKESYDGIEGRLLDFLSARMNFKIQFYLMNEEEIKATTEEKGLIFDELFKKKVEFVVGAFHYKPMHEEDFFVQSDTYFLSRICIVLSSRRDRFLPLTKVVLPFTLSSWIFVMIYFSAGVVVSLAAEFMPRDMRHFILGSGNDAPVYNMFIIALGGGVSRLPRRNFARFLLIVWLLLWIVLRSAYQSALFHFIRMQLSQPLPDSIDDVLKANYEILLTPPTFDTLKYMPVIRAASKFMNGTEVENFPMLAGEQRKIAILTPYEYFGYFRKLNRDRQGEFYMTQEELFTQQLSIYMKKSTFLLHAFSGRIVEYNAVGLQDKSKRSVIDLETRQRMKEPQESRDLNLEDIMGAAEILLLGSVISAVVFAVEILLSHFPPWSVVRLLNRIRCGE